MIGKRIKKLRLKQGLSLNSLAIQAGVSKSYLSAIERGIQSNPSIQFLEKVASVLNVESHTLLSESRDENEEQLHRDWLEIIRIVKKAGVSKKELLSLYEKANIEKNQK